MDPSTILPLELLILITHLLDTSSVFALSLTSSFYNKTRFQTILNGDSIIQDAIRNGHSNLLRWLLPPNERDLILDYDTLMTFCIEAASSNDLQILKYVVGRHDVSSTIFRISNRILVIAAAQGNLEMVKYLIEEKKCYWGDDMGVFFTAIQNNHFDVALYLHKNGCPFPRWWVATK